MQILTRPRLQDLVREVDPTEQLDEEVEELLLQMADDFVESTVGAACLLAKHRKASTVDVKDVQLHLGKLCESCFAIVLGGENYTEHCSDCGQMMTNCNILQTIIKDRHYTSLWAKILWIYSCSLS